MGALGTRHSLRPLICWANGFCKTSGASRRGNAGSYLKLEPRHCEERPVRRSSQSEGGRRKRRSNPFFLCAARWIASRSLSSGARSRDPLARNDGLRIGCLKLNRELSAQSIRELDHLAPLAGRGRRIAPGEGDSPRVPMWRVPSPQPSPRKRGEAAIHRCDKNRHSAARSSRYASNTASAPFTASALSITVFSSAAACTEIFSAKNRASVT
jgi:hypothetical protein